MKLCMRKFLELCHNLLIKLIKCNFYIKNNQCRVMIDTNLFYPNCYNTDLQVLRALSPV